MSRQCSSCGGFCKRSGCERANEMPESELTRLRTENADLKAELRRWQADAVRMARVITQQKSCPECGSEEVSTVSQEENGEIVCAADSCMECNHQWNVG